MSIYSKPVEDKVCPKCGKEGCTCGPDCSCGTEEAQADITKQRAVVGG